MKRAVLIVVSFLSITTDALSIHPKSPLPHNHLGEIQTTLPKTTSSTVQIETTNKQSRRTFFSTTLATFTIFNTNSLPNNPNNNNTPHKGNHYEAQALQERNEMLCNTGFFEHYNEYRCTAIGNILDEGTSKDLSKVEIEKADGLMAKLGMMDVDIVEEDGANLKGKRSGGGQGKKKQGDDKNGK